MVDAFDYLDSRDTADELIQEFGGVAAVRRTTSSGASLEPTLSHTDYSTFAVKVDFTQKQIQAGNVLDTDERWLVAAGPLDALGITSVATPDVLVVGATLHPVLLVKPLAPAGTAVLFDCHIRF